MSKTWAEIRVKDEIHQKSVGILRSKVEDLKEKSKETEEKESELLHMK